LDNWAGTGVDCNGKYVTFTNWKIIDDSAGHVGTGIDNPNDGYTILHNIYVEGIDEGLDIVGVQNQLSNITCRNCNTGIVNNGSEHEYVNCVMRDCINIGFRLRADDCSFTNCTSDGVPTTDFDIDDILRNIFVNCNAPSANVDVDGISEDNRFIGCQFSVLTLQATAVRTVIDDCLIGTLTDGGAFTKQGIDVHINTVDPGINDDLNDGFSAGKSLWYNSATDVMFKCDDASAGAAVWTTMGGAGFDFVTDVASPVTCVDGKQYDNIGAVGAVTYNLPACARESRIRFIVMANQNMIIQAAAGDVITSNGVSSAAGGSATSNSLRSVIELVGMDTTNWVATNQTGTWTIV
jgi:hypothetical protein